eukprot:scaffold3271_cov46-Cyclotella_meneghiniana.AAC.1
MSRENETGRRSIVDAAPFVLVPSTYHTPGLIKLQRPSPPATHAVIVLIVACVCQRRPTLTKHHKIN